VSASQPRLIALAAAGGAAAIGVIALVLGLVHSLSDSSSAPPPGASSEGAAIASAGMDAPGTAELRSLGCDPAIVIDMAKLLGNAGAVRPGEPRYVVTCDVQGQAAPTCERAAATYFSARGVTAAGDVNIRVSRPGTSAPLCSRRYAPSGADLGT
jgi:hypothetical protein